MNQEARSMLLLGIVFAIIGSMVIIMSWSMYQFALIELELSNKVSAQFGSMFGFVSFIALISFVSDLGG